MNPEQLQQWFEGFLQVLENNGINTHDSSDTPRLGVYESISDDPENPHYKIKDAIDHTEPSQDAKKFLAGKKKFSELEGGLELVFDVEHFLNHRAIADIGPEEQLALFNKVKKGEVYIIPPNFDAQRYSCVYIGDSVEGNQNPVYVQQKGISMGFAVQDLEEIEAYLQDNNYKFKDEHLGKLVKAAYASGANDQDTICENVEKARKHEAFPGRQNLDIAENFSNFIMIQNSIGADLSDDLEDPQENLDEANQNQVGDDLDLLEEDEGERTMFSTSMAMAKKSWQSNLLRDYKNHPEFYATEELRKERNKDIYYSEIASFLKSNDLGIFTSDEISEFKTRAASVNSTALLALDNALNKIAGEAFEKGLDEEIKRFGNQEELQNKLDYFFLSGRIVRNNHTYNRTEGEKPWDIYNSIVRDIISGVEVCVRTDKAQGGLPVCYSLNYDDVAGELKLAKGTTVLMSDQEKDSHKKELMDLKDTLNNLGDTSRDSQEYKDMKDSLLSTIEKLPCIISAGRYDVIRRDLSDQAAKYYIAKVDQSMNSRRAGRFRVAEDLFIYPEKFANEEQRLENRIASKIVAAKLKELSKESDWRSRLARLTLSMPGNFKALVSEVKAQPEFRELVDGKSEKALNSIFTSSASKLLATNGKSIKAIMSSLKTQHLKGVIVESQFKNSEVAIAKLEKFTAVLENLAGPKDSKEFVDMKDQLEDTMLALKNTKDEATIQNSLNDLRAKSMRYFAGKISEGMTKTRPNRIKAAMSIASAIDSIAGKKENPMLASTTKRGTLEIMLAARLTKQVLQNAAKKDPNAKRILDDPDAFTNSIKGTFESANFQSFLAEKSDEDLAKLMSLSSSDLCKQTTKNLQKPSNKIMLANIKSIAKYVKSQNSPKPFTKKETLDELDGTNPLKLSVSRGIVMDLCKSKMMQDGYSMEDVLNPKLLGDVKQSYANNIMSLIKDGKAQELFTIMKYGCARLSAQIKDSLNEMSSLDDMMNNEKYKNVIQMGQVFKSMHQDFRHIPNELKNEEDKNLINSWAKDIDTLGEFTNSAFDYLMCAEKFLKGDASLLGKCNEHFSGAYTQYKLVNSIFKSIVNDPNCNQNIMAGLLNGEEPTNALVNLKQAKGFCVGEFDETILFRKVRTSDDLKAVGEKLFDGSTEFDIVLDEGKPNNIKSVNEDKLDREVQRAVVSKQVSK